jgi:polyhydroxyalkanoate synthase subunit PhaC
MQNNFNAVELFNNIAKANHKIAKNYCCNFAGYQRDIHDIALTFSYFYTKLFSEPNEMMKVRDYFLGFLQKQQALYKNVFIDQRNITDREEKNKPLIAPQKGDKRFNAPQWDEYPYLNFIKQSYQLTEQLSAQIVNEVEMGEPIKKKLHFYIQQYTDMLSPSNFLLTNPEVQELTIKTEGENLWRGFTNLLHDIEKGRISQVDQSAFEIGKNLAITPGAVIYENELIQLIQYAPGTKNVYQIPILIVPPWINKYYILDLQPENSFVKSLVDRGFTVFIISWKNPAPGMGHLTFEDYIEKGALKAIEVTKDISRAEKINVLGYCLGGTLLSVACSILAAQKKEFINSITFLASMVDFSDIGPMGDVINEVLVTKLEHGELLKKGVLHGYDMETAFNLIRAKDMIWNYAINNYLKGNTPPPIDVIYWTNDNTNLPAHMYLYYMRQMILENKLSRKNALRICNTQIDIGKIEAPVFVIGMKEDYISPPVTAFTTTELVSGPVEFILGESGHVMGVANPPSKNKYGYYLNGKLGYGYGEWKKTARFCEGSWWTHWSKKLEKVSGKQIASPKHPGNSKYKTIEPAPGRYVKEKC